MKKRSLFLAVALTAVALFGCSKDGEETVIESGQEAYLRELATTLNGSWKGELYSSATNTTEHEDIVFKKWDKPQEVVSLFGTFTGYGVAELRHYYDDGLLLIEDFCIFALDMWGNEPLVIFYPCNDELEVVSREDKRSIELLDGNSFNMRTYGTGEATSLHYTRQN